MRAFGDDSLRRARARRRALCVWSVATIIGVATGCVRDAPDVSFGRYLGKATPTTKQPEGDWETCTFAAKEPFAEADPVCLEGSPYRVRVHRGAQQSLLLYLEGGGACWNHVTCWRARLAKTSADLGGHQGILDVGREEDPFRGWNVVHAAYCDGLVFSGDNAVDYEGRRTYHRGVQNASAAVTLMRSVFPNPDRIVIAGSSAGGYGTISAYRLTRAAYPGKSITVVVDGGPGIQNPTDQVAIEERARNWRYARSLPEGCMRCREQPAYMWDWALRRDEKLKVGLVNHLHDGVLRFFLRMDATEFEDLLTQVSAELHDIHPERFKRLLRSGNEHVVLTEPTRYELEIGGLTPASWIAAMLAGETAWRDVIQRDPKADPH